MLRGRHETRGRLTRFGFFFGRPFKAAGARSS